MSDDRNEETETEAVVALAVPDGFREVAALLTLVTETRACKARLRELRQAAALADKAKATLDAARAEHDATMTRERAELAEQREVLDELRLKLHQRQGMLDHRQKTMVEIFNNPNLRQRRVEVLPGGGTHELGEDEWPPRGIPADDGASGTKSSSSPSRDGFPVGTTITRDQGPPRRRSMRRVQDA